uniref:Uncharacterized protein n=1 Tax=Trichobilharzia regenti TaxID=157069 RepID=A0AA85IVV0_TRIRE|nr:unnamed protein product [Trichobilharzia regenti]
MSTVSASSVGIIMRVVGDGRFRSLLKPSAQYFLCSTSLMIDFPLSSFTGLICVELFPDRDLVV